MSEMTAFTHANPSRAARDFCLSSAQARSGSRAEAPQSAT
jgi:hypothetical protein